MTWHGYLDALRGAHRQALSRAAVPGPLDRNLSLGVAGLCGLATLILVGAAGYHAGFEAIHQVGGLFPGRLLQLLTSVGDALLAICLAALLARRQPRALWLAVIAGGYATVLSLGLKQLFHAARPHVVLGPALEVIGPALHGHSFPSGHAVTVFVTAACFSVGARAPVRLLLFALACAVGASRVWVGAHWPADIVAGAAVAALAVAAAVRTGNAADWGLRLAPHLACVAIVAACAVALLVRGGTDDPLAAPLAMTVAALALAVVAKDYILDPLLAARAAGAAAP